MRTAKRLLIAVMIAGMLFVWPVHPFREVGSVRSGDEGHTLTRPFKVGESLVQSFRAADNNIIQLEFVVTCDDAMPREGELLFELLDKDEAVLYAETMDYAQMADYNYAGPVINRKLRRGGQYAYRLTNLSVTENMPCGVYTADRAMYGLKKGSLELGGERMEGELLTRIIANKPLTAQNTLAIWGCIGLVGFSIYELLTRLEDRGTAKSRKPEDR